MDNIIDLGKIGKLLISDIPVSAISEETGVTPTTIIKYKNGEESIESMTIDIALRLQAFYEGHFEQRQVSFDSQSLIDELELDIEEFGDFECWVWFKTIDGVKVYTDYDFKGEPLDDKEIQIAKENGEEFEILKSGHLLKKLEQQNEIL